MSESLEERPELFPPLTFRKIIFSGPVRKSSVCPGDGDKHKDTRHFLYEAMTSESSWYMFP